MRDEAQVGTKAWRSEAEAREQILSLVSAYYRQFHLDKPSTDGRIAYAGRVYDDAEMCNLVDAALEFWLTGGRYTEAFERDLAKTIGVNHAIFVNSGSSANLLAFMALTAPELGERAIRPGDEVITAAAGFPTTVAPIVQYGAVPVFVDVAIPQYNVEVSQLEQALSSRTKAVFLAHTLGNPFDVGAVRTFCDQHNLWLVEDNCDALGSQYTPKDSAAQWTGTFGDLSTLSFYPPHHITTGEGGAVCTSNPQLYRLLLSFRDWGRDCICRSGQDNQCGRRFQGQYGDLPAGYDHKYVYSHMGYNLKATDMQASVGCAQLKKLPDFIERRKENFRYLRELLTPAEGKIILPEPQECSDPSWFGFLMTVREGCGVTRDQLVQALEAQGIQTRMLFAGNLVRQPCLTAMVPGKDYRVCGSLTNSDRILKDSFWVGVYPGLSFSMLEQVAHAILDRLD